MSKHYKAINTFYKEIIYSIRHKFYNYKAINIFYKDKMK